MIEASTKKCPGSNRSSEWAILQLVIKFRSGDSVLDLLK